MLFEEENREDHPHVLTGRVNRVVFRSEDGFAVLRVLVGDSPTTTIVVGAIGALHEGDSVRISGSWQEHQRFGRQFRVDSYQKVMPETAVGVEAYLARVPDIGPKIAARLVGHFGVNALEIISNSPLRLREVPGIGKKRATSITKALDDDVQTREALIFLQGLGIPLGISHRLLTSYGTDVIERVRSNPYGLVEEIGGIGFRTADGIAQALGLPLDHPHRLRAGLSHCLIKARDTGHLYLPRTELVDATTSLLEVAQTDVESILLEMTDEGLLCNVPGTDDWIGLMEHLELERLIASRLKQLLDVPGGPVPKSDEISFAQTQLGLTLNEEQIAAIETAVRNPISVITGGPGTGKTTILRGTLALLQRRGQLVALAAPTGRAARRLTDMSGALAKTIHRLLEYSPQTESFTRDEDNPLPADVVIVDEVSMVDVPLMVSLCRALKQGASLILVGDADQLPSVGPGLVLHDIIASDVVPVVRLRRVYRQSDESLIVENAHRILNGSQPTTTDSNSGLTDFYTVHLNDPQDIRTAIQAMIMRRIPERFGLDPRTDIQILVPMHRGLLGAESLNEWLQDLLNPDGMVINKRGNLRVGDRVIQIRNNYELDVANGDVGILMGPGIDDGSVIVRFDGRDVTFPPDRQDGLRLAYALSIHKSQGSEYPAVIIPLHTQHYMMLRRNLLYTAVTRGRRLVVLVGSKRAVGIAISRNDAIARYTLLAELLRAHVGG